MRIVVVGASGQLGREMVRALAGADVVALGHTDLDLCDVPAIGPRIAALRPALVLNATAENRVDFVERDSAPAIALNVTAVEALATACRAAQAFFVHVSTDYVFDGRTTRPYTEDDPPNPQSAYARSKYAGEQRAALTSRHAVVRVAGLYARGGSRGKGGNFVDKILAQARAGQPLRVVDDQITAPTWARDVATTLARLFPRWVRGTAPTGMYHLTNGGACSWFAFARAILAHAGVTAELVPTTTASFAAPAARPPYSVLANTRLAALGEPPLPSWEDALARYLAATD